MQINFTGSLFKVGYSGKDSFLKIYCEFVRNWNDFYPIPENKLNKLNSIQFKALTTLPMTISSFLLEFKGF